jgi:hypothetical protein
MGPSAHRGETQGFAPASDRTGHRGRGRDACPALLRRHHRGPDLPCHSLDGTGVTMDVRKLGHCAAVIGQRWQRRPAGRHSSSR